MAGRLFMPRVQVNFVIGHALRAWPYECCGVLLGGRSGDGIRVSRVRAAENISDEDLRVAYQVGWSDLLAATRSERSGRGQIVGFYHSHPDGPTQPSLCDRERAWPGAVYMIAGVGRMGPALSAWQLGDGGAFEPVRISCEETDGYPDAQVDHHFAFGSMR